MKKKYLIEFKHGDGNTERIELTTDNIEYSIQQWMRNRHVVDYEILEESSSNSKQMLFG